ncbi:hypothetical protein [Actinomadura sp. 6N118]|uniref:hypothetical protein n=1 Tax=Actinomadura sp. 6N118 TaxID=3375151 RepID=UPI00378D8C6D
MLSTMISQRRDRAASRRGYHQAAARLDESLGALFEVAERDQRAGLLEAAAAATDTLAALHTPAWGAEPDAAGRPREASLRDRADLLRQVAATERGVLVGVLLAEDVEDNAEVYAELRVWAELADAAMPGRRADLLGELAGLSARRVGADAAQVLRVLADCEAHLAARAVGGCARPHPADESPRLLVAAALALTGAIAVAPSLTWWDRTGLGAVVAAAFWGAVWLIDRRRGAAG